MLLFEMHRRSARKLWAKRTPQVKEQTLRCAIILALDLAREANRKLDWLEREWLFTNGLPSPTGRQRVLNEVWSRSVTVQTDLSYVETQRWRQEALSSARWLVPRLLACLVCCEEACPP